MMRYIALCVLLLFPSGATANEAPPVPEGGLQFLAKTTCLDAETGERGVCHFAVDKAGEQYVIFWQGDDLMFVRQIVGDSYITVWMNDKYNTF